MGSKSPPSSLSKRLSKLLTFSFLQGASNNVSHHERQGHTDMEALKDGILGDLASQAKRVPEDLHLVLQLIDLKAAGGYEDDSRYVLEHLIQLVASLPPGNVQKSMTTSFISTLWDNLLHPPLSYLGSDLQYRSADGSNNNIMYPNLGKAGTPYAKSVVAVHPRLAAPPDAGTLFDALLIRKAYKPHPSKISSLFFNLATLVIHDIFYTDPTDPNINLTSSYLDLSTLYGFNQAQQDMVRTKSDGLLKPDSFWDARLLGFPPAVAGLMIGLNRFHNSVVQELASINEGGRFSLPNVEIIEATVRMSRPDLAGDQLAAMVQEKYNSAVQKRDNDLFQTGRLVTCGLYINIVLGDYLRTIIAVNRTNDPWVLDPRAQGPDVYSHQGAPSGVGNVVSCEFNLIYRWHATLSQVDEKWVTDFMAKLFPGKDMAKISVDEFKLGVYKWAKTIDPDPFKRSVGDLQRDANGKFDDAALVGILTASTEDCAAAFNSGIPVALRAVTMLGVEQSRSWNTASLNEFRHFFGLVEHNTFEHVNDDLEMQKLLRQLYEHPNNIELYPGILIENTKEKMIPGSGLCPNQTIGKAILSDAIALVRGDRFFTVDYSPRTLTQFGFNEVATDMDVAKGGVLYRVFMRAFPGWYDYNSVFALFPLTVPSENKRILTGLGSMSAYSFEPPSAPKRPCILTTARSARGILTNALASRVVWDKAVCGLTGGSLPAEHRVNAAATDKLLKQAIYDDVPKGLEEIWNFYVKRTTQLIGEAACKFNNISQVDIVRDVFIPVHTHFVAALFALPLKDGEAEKRLYEHLTLLFGYSFLKNDEIHGFTLKAKATKTYRALVQQIKSNVGSARRGGKLKELIDGKSGSLDSYGVNLIQRLAKAGKSVDEIAVDIVIPTAAAIVASHVMQSTQMLDTYLSEGYNQYWPEIVRSAQSKEKSDLRGYAIEGSRLSETGFGLVRCGVSQEITIKDGSSTWNLESGDAVHVNLTAVNRDPEAFPEPAKLDPKRRLDVDLPYGWGLHTVGTEISITANAAILSCLARLPNLRRAPGVQGQVKSLVQNGQVRYLTQDWGDYSVLPASMKVEYQ